MSTCADAVASRQSAAARKPVQLFLLELTFRKSAIHANEQHRKYEYVRRSQVSGARKMDCNLAVKQLSGLGLACRARHGSAPAPCRGAYEREEGNASTKIEKTRDKIGHW